MPRFDYRSLPGKERLKVVNDLVEVLINFRDKDELRRFLQRLLTPSEIFMLARRLQIAEELIKGKTYLEIREKLKVGFSTCQSVDSWLEHAVSNYQDMRARIQSKERQKKTTGNVPFRQTLPHSLILLDLLLQSGNK